MDSTKEKELIISGSNVPLIRAGFANIIFLVFFFFIAIINQFLSEMEFLTLSRTIFALLLIGLAIKIYIHSVSRLYKEGDDLVILGPISEKRIPFYNITKKKIYVMPASMTIVLMIRTKHSVLPSFFFFVAISKYLGPFNDTKEKLALIFK